MSKPAAMTIAEALVNYLVSENIRAIFGLTGESLIGFDKAATPLIENGILDYAPIFNEISIPHALHSYYRASCGMVGVGVVTQGMGLTHMDNGLRGLYVDAVPAIIINGQLPAHLQKPHIGPYNATNYLLNAGSPFVKTVFSPRTAAEALQCIPYLLRAAKEGIPGPVMLELSSDIAQKQVGYLDLRRTEDFASTPPSEHKVKEFVDALLAAKHPLFVFGEILRADEEAVKLAHELTELSNAAYLNSFRQFDVIPETERFGGVLSITNSEHVSAALIGSEIFVIGHRTSQELTENFSDPRIKENIKFHVYPSSSASYPFASNTLELPDENTFNSNYLRCDVKDFLRSAVKELKDRGIEKQPIAGWVRKMREYQINYSESLKDDGLFPSVLSQLGEAAYSDKDGHNIMIGDSGNYHHQLNIMRHRHNGFCATPRRTMAYSSGAVGAYWGLKHREWHGTIFATQGDGSYLMAKHQLNQAMSAEPGNVNIVTCVFDNGGYENVDKAHEGKVHSRISRKGLWQENIPSAVKAGFPDMLTQIIGNKTHADIGFSKRSHHFLYVDDRDR